MARTVAGPKPGSARAFVPKAFDNHLDDGPVTVEISSPSEREKRELLRLLHSSFAFDEDGAATEKTRPSEDTWIDRSITAHVLSVRNYNGAAGQITAAADLLEHGEYLFLVEIANEILSAASLSSGDLKNSSGSLPSSAPTTQAEGSTAEIA